MAVMDITGNRLYWQQDTRKNTHRAVGQGRPARARNAQRQL